MEHTPQAGADTFPAPISIPERWRTVLRTRQVEHAVQLLGDVYTPHTLKLPRGGSVQFCYEAFELGSLHCGRLQYGCEVAFATTQPLDYLNLSVLWQGRAEMNGQVFCRGDTAALHGVEVPRMRLSADAQIVNVRIQLQELWRIDRLLHGDGGGLSDALRLHNWLTAEHPASQWLRSAVGFLAHTPRTGQGCDSLLTTRLREGLLMQLLSLWPRECGSSTGPPPVTRYVVQRAIDYIESTSELVPSLQELAQVTGVGMRSLHRAFVTHLGMPPMRYVLQRRLERARLMLLSTHGPSTIAEVAIAQGFQNFGEFSALYRRQFGELPRVTRKKNAGEVSAVLRI